jgi:hypothetical protein
MSRTILSATAPLVLATAVLAMGAGPITAQERSGSPLTKLSSNQIMAAYSEQTWQRFVAATGGSNPTAWDDDGPPPTDCPPKPTQECINSWKVMPVNPFE